MSLWGHVRVREDLLDKSLDQEVAPSLHRVVAGEGHRIYVDSREFIERTYVTKFMRDLVSDLISRVSAGRGGTIALPSAFGGGKTHTLIFIYHLFKNPELLKSVVPGASDEVVRDVSLVVVDGTHKAFSPSPIEPLTVGGRTIKTLWGYIAHQLGTYDSVKELDEKLVAPEMYGVSQILRDKKVLILVDELGIYYRRLARAPRPEERELLTKYVDQVVLFMRILSEYSKNSKTVVVVSIPAESTDKGLEPEPGYEEFVEKVGKEIFRAAERAGKPVTTSEDFTNILKKRIFEEVKSSGAELAASRFSNLRVSYSEEFEDLVDEVRDSYPFHPHFIKTLRDVVERNKNLQKTRDALRIARVVVRRLWKSKSNALLITPSDIDLRDHELRSLIITEDYRSFDNVIDKIINKTIKELPVPPEVSPEVYRDLAYRLALYVFLRTYVYKPHLEPMNVFPTKREVITATYDPLRYEAYEVSPKRVSELLDEISSGGVDYRVPHLYVKEGRYWVTTFLDINELIENEASKVEDSKALSHIMNEVRELYVKPYDVSKGGSAEARFLSSVPYILLRPEVIDFDDQKYVLVTVLEPVSGFRCREIVEGDIYKLIYYRASGNSVVPRRNKNTVTVMLSDDNDMWGRVKKEVKRLIACDNLRKTIERQYAEKTVAKILKEELSEMYNKIKKSFMLHLFNYFKYLVFPDHAEGVDVARCVPLEKSGKTLLEIAEVSLNNNGKTFEETSDFDILPYLIKGSKEWSDELRVGDVKKIFYENPAKPMVPSRFVSDLVMTGIRNLKIGLLRDEKVFFKEIEGLEKISEVLDSDVIIPWPKAVDALLKILERVEEIPSEGCVNRRYYTVIHEDGEIPLYELKTRRPHDYAYIFKDSKVVLRSERVCDTFELELMRKEVLVDLSGEFPNQVDVNVLVKRIGRFSSEVRLRVSEGTVEPASGVPDFEALWVLRTPSAPGEYTYFIEGLSEGVQPRRNVLKVRVVEKAMCSDKTPAVNTVCDSIVFSGSIPVDVLIEALRSLKKAVRGVKRVRKSSIKVLPYGESDKRSKLEVVAEDIKLEDLEAVSRSLKQVFGVVAGIMCESLVVYFEGGGVVEDVEELENLNKRISGCKASLAYCCRG